MRRFLGGPSSAKAAARDASSILRVASSMARDAASMAIASRSVYRSCKDLWVGVGGRLSSSPLKEEHLNVMTILGAVSISVIVTVCL